MSYRVTLIPGDGIGSEITKAATRVIEHTGVKIDWDVEEAGLSALEKYHDPLPQSVIDSIDKNRIALKGPLTTPIGKGFRSVKVGEGNKVTKDISPQNYVVTDQFADAFINELDNLVGK